MTIARQIRRTLEAQAENLRASDVRIGLGYTAVKLADDRAGVAYTFTEGLRGGCSIFTGKNPLAGLPAGELLAYLDSSDPVEVAVGLATANALANNTPENPVYGDVLEELDLRPSDTVCMVGFFAPLIDGIEQRAGRLEICEETASANTRFRAASDAVDLLSSCDVAIITSTAIINGTVDGLLDAASSCREAVMLGSSTPLIPQVFDQTPITLLSGITINDPEGILRTVGEGRGTRFFKPFVTKWNVRLRR